MSHHRVLSALIVAGAAALTIGNPAAGEFPATHARDALRAELAVSAPSARRQGEAVGREIVRRTMAALATVGAPGSPRSGRLVAVGRIAAERT